MLWFISYFNIIVYYKANIGYVDSIRYCKRKISKQLITVLLFNVIFVAL